MKEYFKDFLNYHSYSGNHNTNWILPMRAGLNLLTVQRTICLGFVLKGIAWRQNMYHLSQHTICISTHWPPRTRIRLVLVERLVTILDNGNSELGTRDCCFLFFAGLLCVGSNWDCCACEAATITSEIDRFKVFPWISLCILTYLIKHIFASYWSRPFADWVGLVALSLYLIWQQVFSWNAKTTVSKHPDS